MTTGKVRVLFMVDIKKRDLITYFILRKQLEKKNIEVFFCRNGMEIPTVIKHKINIIILTQLLSKEWIEVAKKLKKLNCIVISLPSEGNPFDAKMKKKNSVGPYKGSFKAIDHIFTWTKEMAELLKIENDYIGSPKITWLGYHRLIPMKKKYKKFRKNLLQLTNLNINKKYKLKLLFTSNFVQGDYWDYPSENNNLKKDNSTISEAKRDSQARGEFINFFNRISKNKNYFFILKIHPMEKPDIYLKKINFSENVYLSLNDYIESLLEFSNILIGRSCHTQYEAIALNKLTIELILKKSKNFNLKSNISNLQSISSLETFDKICEAYLNNDMHFRTTQKLKVKMLEKFNFNKEIKSEEIFIKEIIKVSKTIKDTNIKNKISFFEHIYYLIKYETLSRFSYLFHDIFYLNNFKKKLNGYYYYIDYRRRIDKHFHSKDIDNLNKLYE